MTQTVRFLLSLWAAALLAVLSAGDARATAPAADEPPVVAFARPSVVVAESAQQVVLMVTVSAPATRDAAVTVQPRGGTATVGTDVFFEADPPTLTFAADEPQPQPVVVTIAADAEREGIEFVDLVLRSDDLALGAQRTLRLWIRDDVLYPGRTAGALRADLQSDFAPAMTLNEAAAADTLLGALWAEDSTVQGAFGAATARVTGDERPAVLAREHGLVVGSAWPAEGMAKSRVRHDLHGLLPLADDARRTQRAALARLADAPADADVPTSLLPTPALRGDVARAILYLHAIYPDRAGSDGLAPMKATLARWMDEDPVDDRELRRTLAIMQYQGTPNPFVLAPDLAEAAFNLRGTYPAPTVSFVQQGTTVPESDSVAVLDVRVAGVGDEDVTLTVALDAAASSVGADDLDGFRYRTVRFPAGAPDGTTRSVRVPIAHDEADEGTERAVFTLHNMSGFAHAGAERQHVLRIENAQQPADEDGRIVLGPAYPNPLSPGRGATVRFEVEMAEAMPFSIEVFSTLGQRVRMKRYSAGEAARMEAIEINAHDLPSGLYILRLQAPAFTTTETFVVVR